MFEITEHEVNYIHYVINREFGEFVRVNNSEYDELFSVGLLGLAIAHKNFDNSKGFKFITYAHMMIKGEMMKYCKRVFDKHTRNHFSFDFEINSSLVESGNKSITITDGIGVHDDYYNLAYTDIVTEAKRHFTDEDVAIIELKMQDFDQYEIADKLNLNQSYICRRLKVMKNYFYHNIIECKSTRKHLSEDEIFTITGECIDLYEQGFSYSAIAEELNITDARVDFYLRRVGISGGFQIKEQKKLGKLIAIDVLDHGLTFKKVAKKYNTNVHSARRYFNKFGEVS